MNKYEFNQYFDRKFNNCKGNDFENWFAQLAQCVWETDFEQIKPSGSAGDKKCDGRRISTETIFQCYAPESPSTFAKNAVAKINDSFPAVQQYWPNLKEWCFLHNNEKGITAAVSDKLEELRQQYPNIKIYDATRQFLKDKLHDNLTGQQMIDVYPNCGLPFHRRANGGYSPVA